MTQKRSNFARRLLSSRHKMSAPEGQVGSLIGRAEQPFEALGR